MQNKKPTRKELLQEITDLRQEIDILDDKLVSLVCELNRMFAIFDQACADVLDPIDNERVRQKIAELTKPDEPETSPIIT